MIDFDYHIRKSAHRKTVSITVYPDNRVLVAVPTNMSQKSVLQFIEAKSAWVRKNITRNLEKAGNTLAPRRFVNGEKLLYLGDEYTLRIEEGSPEGVFLSDGEICVRLHEDFAGKNRSELIRGRLLKWYVDRVKTEIEKRIRIYRVRIGVMPQSVTIKRMKSRWGSCSSKGRINLAWNIIMAPEAVLDYLIVHELCHMVHHNHSAAYWGLVESVFPDHRERRSWLRKHGECLIF